MREEEEDFVGRAKPFRCWESIHVWGFVPNLTWSGKCFQDYMLGGTIHFQKGYRLFKFSRLGLSAELAVLQVSQAVRSRLTIPA